MKYIESFLEWLVVLMAIMTALFISFITFLFALAICVLPFAALVAIIYFIVNG